MSFYIQLTREASRFLYIRLTDIIANCDVDENFMNCERRTELLNNSDPSKKAPLNIKLQAMAPPVLKTLRRRWLVIQIPINCI